MGTVVTVGVGAGGNVGTGVYVAVGDGAGVGVTVSLGVAAGVVVTAGVAGVAGVDEPPPPLELPLLLVEPPLVLLVSVEQRVADGVIVIVWVVDGEYLTNDWLALQTNSAAPVFALAERRFKSGAVTSNVEPERSVMLKSVALTVIDSIVALEPETLRVMPFTLMTASVVRVTSSAAASARVGARRSATAIPARASVRDIVCIF